MWKVQPRCSKPSVTQFDDAAIVIKAAAVADYRPKEIHPQKMKKQAGDSVIELERTTDILKTIGAMKTNQILVGFAAETENAVDYGMGKLESKNLDYIIVNDVTDPDAGFGNDTNVVTLLSKHGTHQSIPSNAEKRTGESVT